MEKGGGGGGAAPTGCYKCGRPGHWSRDCPSAPNTNGENLPRSNPTNTTSSYPPKPPNIASAQKPKQKAPRLSLPKLTPELLLSDAGLGHILRYFPRALKCRGRGHEVDDLRHLLGLYADWNTRLLPYYNFEQFINKVEQVGTTRRVKMCLNDLRDKVANGADPTKLHESQVQQNSSHEQDAQDGLDMSSDFQETTSQNKDTSNFEEDMADVIWEKATKATTQSLHDGNVADYLSGQKEMPSQRPENDASSTNKNQMSEEQIARMEANKLKALERAAAKARLKSTSVST